MVFRRAAWTLCQDRDVRPALCRRMMKRSPYRLVLACTPLARAAVRQSTHESNGAVKTRDRLLPTIRLEVNARLSNHGVFQKEMKMGSAPNDITLSNEIHPSRLIRDQRQASRTIESDVSRQATGLEGGYWFEAVRVEDRHAAGRAQAQIQEGLIGSECDLLERGGEVAAGGLPGREMPHIDPTLLIPAIETQAIRCYHTAKWDAAEIPPPHHRQRSRIELEEHSCSPCRHVTPLAPRMNRQLRACVRQTGGADDATAVGRDGDDKQPVEVRCHVQRSTIGRHHRSEGISLHRNGTDAELPHEVDDSDILGELIRDPGSLARRRQHDSRRSDTDGNEPHGDERLES